MPGDSGEPPRVKGELTSQAREDRAVPGDSGEPPRAKGGLTVGKPAESGFSPFILPARLADKRAPRFHGVKPAGNPPCLRSNLLFHSEAPFNGA